MAENNPNNLYSGYAQVFNSMPYIAQQTKLLAQKQAHQAALDNFYKTLPSKINDKGLRDTERPILDELSNNYQQHYIENKNAILNPSLDGGKAALEHERLYRTMQDVVGSSTNAGRAGIKFGQYSLLHPNINQRYDIKEQIAQNEEPTHVKNSEGVYVPNPKHKVLNPDLMAIPFGDYSGKLQDQDWKATIAGLKPDKVKGQSKSNPDTQKIETEVYDAYPKDSWKAIAERHWNVVSGGDRAKQYYNDKLNDQNWLGAALPAYQAVYGETDENGNHNVIDNIEKAAKAEAILKASLPSNKRIEYAPDLKARREANLQDAFAKQENASRLRWNNVVKKADFESKNIANNIENLVKSAEDNGIDERNSLGKVISRKLNFDDRVLASLEKTAPYIEPLTTPQGAANPNAGKIALDPNGKPIMYKVQAKAIRKLPDGRYEVEFSNGEKALRSIQGIKGDLIASPSLNTKLKINEVVPSGNNGVDLGTKKVHTSSSKNSGTTSTKTVIKKGKYD